MRRKTGTVLAGLLLPLAVLMACGEKPEPIPEPEKPDTEKEPVPDPKPDPEPAVQSDPVRLSLTKTAIANMDYTYDAASDTYSITTTTADDPFVFTAGLAERLRDDCVVLSFEYTAAKDIDDFQVFYPPLKESRSGHFGAMERTASFRPFACNLASDREKFSWGGPGSQLRLDFGHTRSNTIRVRNLQIRPMNAAEEKEYRDKLDQDKSKEAQAVRIRDYLARNFSSAVTDVEVNASEVVISGTAAGADGYSLVEITPYDPFTEAASYTRTTPLSGRSFSVTLPRRVTADGFPYDRLLSRWAVVKGNTLDSHARYADRVSCAASPAEALPKSKKGLGGFFGNATQTGDLDELGITSVTVNIVINVLVNTDRDGNFSLEHSYGGKTYYISSNEQNNLDRIMKACARRGIVVSAIILNRRTDNTASTRILTHPESTGGPYSMPNMTTAGSVHLYAAVLDYLASRYNGGANGRIHHWIMHNEVDFQKEWTNMGDQPEMLYMDTYVKSMRMASLIARQYDSHAASLISLTHCWTQADGEYAPKDLLDDLRAFGAAEGDFWWGVAAHPYPQDLNQPEFWKNDTRSTYTRNTKYITFKNLEVLSDWALQPENRYRDGSKRIVFLSENGTNSPSYSDEHLARQAAGACWMWKKVSRLEGIDAVQWHNWRDNKEEGGLRIGLRRFPESPDNSAVKPVWTVYKAAGTADEDAVFAPYLQTVGIASWEDIHHAVE